MDVHPCGAVHSHVHWWNPVWTWVCHMAQVITWWCRAVSTPWQTCQLYTRPHWTTRSPPLTNHTQPHSFSCHHHTMSFWREGWHLASKSGSWPVNLYFIHSGIKFTNNWPELLRFSLFWDGVWPETTDWHLAMKMKNCKLMCKWFSTWIYQKFGKKLYYPWPKMTDRHLACKTES